MCTTLEGEFLGSACGRHGPYIPDVLFWSIILFFTTFFLSSFLKHFKTESYFPTKVRCFWHSPCTPAIVSTLTLSSLSHNIFSQKNIESNTFRSKSNAVFRAKCVNSHHKIVCIVSVISIREQTCVKKLRPPTQNLQPVTTVCSVQAGAALVWIAFTVDKNVIITVENFWQWPKRGLPLFSLRTKLCRYVQKAATFD